MTLDKFLATITLLLGFIGSIFVLKSILAMTPNVIAELAVTRWDFSIPTLENLAAQKADGIVGIVLIVLAFLFQITSEIFLSSKVIPFLTLTKSFVLAILVSVILGITAFFVGRSIETYTKLESGKAILRKHIKDQSDKIENLLNPAILKSIEEYSAALIKLNRKPDESDIEFLVRVGKTVGFDLDEKLKPAIEKASPTIKK